MNINAQKIAEISREIAQMAKVQVVGNLVYVGLKIPQGGLSPAQSQSPARRALYAKMVENLNQLGIVDAEKDTDPAVGIFGSNAVYVPIDMAKHAHNRELMSDVIKYSADFMRHRQMFPRDWQY